MVAFDDSKQKLTLGISKKVIERAKAAGINISAITEELLTAVTYQPSQGNTRDDVVKAYEALFKAIDPVLIQYGEPPVEVGKALRIKEDGSLDERPIAYSTYAGLYSDPEGDEKDIRLYEVANKLSSLYKPTKLLNNLILTLIESAEENREKIRELEMALRFVKALSDGEKEK